MFPSDVTRRLLPNEEIQFYVTASIMSCYFTDKRIMYKANSALEMAKSDNFSLFRAGLSIAMKRQDYEDIPYKRIESVTIKGSGFLVPELEICLIGGRVLTIRYSNYDLALQAQQFVMSKILLG